MPKFYKNRRYANKKGQQFGKGVWVDDDGNIIYPGQSRMGEDSRKTRTVTQYNSDGTKTVYPWEEWAKKNQRDHEVRVLQNDRKYAIPYIPEKRMTITIDENSPTRHAAGATFSENLLDSIAVNAKKAGLPFSTAIGLVAQESAFGKGGRGVGKSMLPWDRLLNASSGDVKDKAKAISYHGYYSPSLLISNWKQRQEGPFYKYNYNSQGYLLDTPKSDEFYNEDINATRKEANKYRLKDESPLEHGFKKYEDNPEEWNHNNPNYPQEVKEKTSELVNYSPEIRAYMKKNHLHAGGGSLEQPLPWNKLSLREKAEIIKRAVGAGMYSLRDIKSTYTSQIEDGSYACGGYLFKKGGSQNNSSSLAQKAMQYFVGKGLTQEQAAGLVGNLQRESGLNYQAVNPNGGAVGIAQWLGSRKKKLFEKYGKNPTFDDQLDYVWYELNTTHKNGLKKLRESKTVDDAAMNAFGYYEFSAGPAAAIRSMNSHGMNTKWKNGDGSTAMTRGIVNGRKLLGATPSTSSEALEVSLVSALPQFLFERNPTDYGIPVDYSTSVKPVVEDIVPFPVEERQNGWEILNLLQGLGAPQQATQPLASYQSLAENSSPYVVGVPSASTTMLDVSWFAGGGPLGGSYSDWKKAIAEYKGIHPDEDNTYDYEGYYKRYPAQAWAMLDNDPEAHFVDEFKTVYHPSFSNQSKYSSIVDTRYNPEGIIGGTWSEDGRSYTLSEDQARHRWDIGNTMDYFSGAEDNGVEGFYPDGRHWTTAEGDIWGGILPAVEITPDKYSNGGYIFGEGGTRTHSFTYDTPVKYNGASYPASSMVIDGKEMQVFAGGDGSLWSIGDNGKPRSVIYQHELPEVVISPVIKNQQENIQKMQRDYSTLSNDATAIYTGKLLNPHLTDRTIAGAKSHAAWEKDHPNLAAWSYAAGAVPFAIASAPIVAGLGDITAGTAIGQGITNSLTAMTNAVQGSTWLPWVDAAATSYFGAHGVNEIAQGNMNPETVLEITPLSRFAKPVYNAAYNLYDKGTLFDKYTTLGGRLGNYSNNFLENIYATAARRFDLSDKARIPTDAMRKMNFGHGKIVPVNNGRVVFTGGRTVGGKPHMNSTTDRGVVSHSVGQWDPKDGYIFSTQDFIDQTLPNGSLKSIEPSDMFSNGVNVSMPVEKVTFVSGDVEALNKAREAGMQTLSSPRLRRMYNTKWQQYQKDVADGSKNTTSLLKEPKRIGYWKEYANEVDRLMSTRGAPTLADYRLLEQQTGLDAGVAPVSEYDNALRFMYKMPYMSVSAIKNGTIQPFTYPNGRVVDWSKVGEELQLLERAKYNNVFYDPASQVEFNWKEANGLLTK